MNVKPIQEEVNFPKLRLLQGGKGPPINTTGDNWLVTLDRGTVFACSRKGQEEFVLGLFCVLYKHNKTIILGDALGTQPNVPVDPVKFCKRHDLHEILKEGSLSPEGDDNDQGSIRSGGVADDADAAGRQPQHDDTQS